VSARRDADDVQKARTELFRGLYDGSSGRSGPPIAAARSAAGSNPMLRRPAAPERPFWRGPTLLNPECADDDATARRFSLLEIE